MYFTVTTSWLGVRLLCMATKGGESMLKSGWKWLIGIDFEQRRMSMWIMPCLTSIIISRTQKMLRKCLMKGLKCAVTIVSEKPTGMFIYLMNWVALETSKASLYSRSNPPAILFPQYHIYHFSFSKSRSCSWRWKMTFSRFSVTWPLA